MRDRETDSDNNPEPCEWWRGLISARADGQADPAETGALDTHLAECADCSGYAEGVAALMRTTRVRRVATDHTFVEQVLANATPVRLGRGGWMRPALAWCALMLVVQSVGPLVFGELDGAPTHVARHIGASTLALGIGLSVVAWRPERAAGMLPFATALFGAMLAGAVFDMLSGHRSPAAELLHVGELLGMLLLWLVAGSPGWDRVERIRHQLTHRRASARSTI